METSIYSVGILDLGPPFWPLDGPCLVAGSMGCRSAVPGIVPKKVKNAWMMQSLLEKLWPSMPPLPRCLFFPRQGWDRPFLPAFARASSSPSLDPTWDAWHSVETMEVADSSIWSPIYAAYICVATTSHTLSLSLSMYAYTDRQTLHYIPLHCIAIHYIALHCIALHYITYIHTYTHTDIQTYIH